MDSYYIVVSTQRLGPLSLTELAHALIDGQTPIWRPGLPQWVRANELPELRELLTTLPPPVPRTSAKLADGVRSRLPTGEYAARRKSASPSPFEIAKRRVGAFLSGVFGLLVALALIAKAGISAKPLWQQMERGWQEKLRQKHDAATRQSR
jgi:hypothetical protein